MIQYDLIHASGNTFMPVADEASDVANLLEHEALLYTLTECGERVTIDRVKAAAKRHGGYHVVNPDRGDIAFVVRHDATVLGTGGPLAIPAQPGPAARGGHGPRHNSWIQFDWNGETITHTGVHFVTAHVDHGTNTGNRSGQQLTQARLMGAQVRAFGAGHKLATGSGDLNAVLPRNTDMQAIFDQYGLTTTSEETGVMTGTHGAARIDYVWTSDADGRLSVPSMKVLKSPKYDSDHDPVKVTIAIEARP